MLSNIQNLFFYRPQAGSEVTNIHPTKKDAFGFSAIERAIFDERLEDVSSLLGESSLPTGAKFASYESNELSALLVSDQYNELKKAISQLPVDQIKEGIKNPKFSQFVQFLDQFSANLFEPFDQHLIHLLALFANSHLVIQALKLHPEWAILLDNQGNNLAHYGALNSDESVMITLVEKGVSLFQENAKEQTPLALFVHRVQKQDPLNWDKRDIFLFLNSWLPTTLQLAVKSGILPLSLEAIASTVASLALHSSLNYLISFYPYLSILFSKCHTPFQKFLLAAALVGTSWIPIVNLPIQAYITYCFVHRAYQTLGQTWQHLKHRPIKAICISMIKTANALDQISSFYNCFSVFKPITQTSSYSSTQFEKESSALTTHQEPASDESTSLSEEFSKKPSPTSFSQSTNPPAPSLNFYVRLQQTASAELNKIYRQAIRATDELNYIGYQAKQVVDPYLPKTHELAPFSSTAPFNCSNYRLPPSYNYIALAARVDWVEHPECEEGAKIILQDFDTDFLLAQLEPSDKEYSERVKRIQIAADTLFKAREKRLQADVSVCENYSLPMGFDFGFKYGFIFPELKWKKLDEQLELVEYPQCKQVAEHFRGVLTFQEGLDQLNPQNHPGHVEKYTWLTKKLVKIFKTLEKENQSSIND